MQQQELFEKELSPNPTHRIPGFLLIKDYIDSTTEKELLSKVEDGPWQHDFKRRIQQYGLGYTTQRGGAPTWLRDFPDWLLELAGRVAKDASMPKFPENCVINEYIPPQGIAPHRDYPAFGPVVACVSLGSDIVMDFLDPSAKSRSPVFVPARSFWAISGAARWKWMHGIAPRLNDIIAGERRARGRRVSITFRTAADRETSRSAKGS